jgi:site-specific DNA recombinase
VLNMLELSWGGTCTHVREGYNIGKPPYGYQARKLRHPNPAKAEKGITKTRLEPDGVRGATVTLIAKWRYHEHLGFDTIAERLNQDLDRYPPPDPPGGVRARGAWSKSSVADVLKNPKYTGYQVYNRRARRSRGGRNKPNPPQMWVWSNEPAHEPLIPKWMFDEFNTRSADRKGSRDGASAKKDPQATRTYLLRRRVVCDCGRLMIGNPRHGVTYYRCHPANNNRGRPDKYAGHPATIYMREDLIMAEVSRFFADRVFGSHRRQLFLAELNTADDDAGWSGRPSVSGCSASSPTRFASRTTCCAKLRMPTRTIRSRMGCADATTIWTPNDTRSWRRSLVWISRSSKNRTDPARTRSTSSTRFRI